MVKALLTIDAAVFYRTPDGRVHTQSVANYDEYWTIPRQSFDQLIIMTRLQEIAKIDDSWRPADGDGVVFRTVPFYKGPYQYLAQSKTIRNTIQASLEECDVLLCNGPGTLSAVGIDVANQLKKLYALDVLADPYDVYAPGAMTHPLRPYLRWRQPRQLRKWCQDACAVNYVTKQALQRRYPASADVLSTGISDVHLPSDTIVGAPRLFGAQHSPISLIYVGTLAQLYKAPDILIAAVGICIKEGLNINLTIAGDGQFRQALEAQATALGVTDKIHFLGAIPAGAAVRQQLDKADLFVLPSYQEGLPKAMVEAMARALPCIGSSVGGIPELLAATDLVPAGDAVALATKIREVVTDPQRMTEMSARNLDRAKDYRSELLRAQRIDFYQHISKYTADWLSQKSPHK
ncbi:glycosyltransferase family 4 protein [Chamaesiphon sp.]|uniref:glycosyltransferase family 4 protein n=1 Tax=Chamaesiphon sp. TaxID=2814140 RepID=UPI003592FF0F